MRAFKVGTKAVFGYSIYIAETAGAAKTLAVMALKDAYREADYSWIKSCRRVSEFDYLAPGNDNSCIAWVEGEERWQIDRGHWWEGSEPAPVEEVKT